MYEADTEHPPSATVGWAGRWLIAVALLCTIGLGPHLVHTDATRRSAQERRLSELRAYEPLTLTEGSIAASASEDEAAEDVLTSQWQRLLSSEYSAARLVWRGATYALHGDANVTELPANIICNDILYTSHPNRRDDRELDTYRQAWSETQSHNCFFVISVQKYMKDGLEVPAKAARQWRKRTPKPAIGLVDRYRGGLILMALVGLGRISTETGGQPWILYVDSDTMMVNSQKGIADLVSRVAEAAGRSTVEEEQCFILPALWQCYDDDDGSAYSERLPAIILGVSDGCSNGYNTQSGAILFQTTALTGFVFELLAKSPLYAIDTKHYQLGDQAVWDWLTERAFRMDWSRLRAICADTERKIRLLREPCENAQFVFRRDYAGTMYRDGHWLINDLHNTWTGNDKEALVGNIAWNCVRWFNSPGCPNRRDDSRPFSYRCGDPVWHLYGCTKNAWKQGALNQLLNTPECTALLPKPIPPAPVTASKKQPVVQTNTTTQ